MDVVDCCLARIQLSNAEVQWLTDRPDAAHEVPPDLRCYLQLGHDGPHAALGQQGRGIEWWLRWTLLASEVVQTTMCPVRSATVLDSDGNPELCLLFDAHPGAHSYEYDHP